MKSTGTIEAGTGLWYAPNKGATNSSGFTGLPGGARDYDGSFYYIGVNGCWWSSTESSTTFAWARYRFLHRNNGYVNRGDYYKRNGFSVRCLRD